MDKENNLNRKWRFLQGLLHNFIVRRFNLDAVPCELEDPCIIISNHVTTWDPLLLSMSFRRKNIHFVASEHLFRLGLISKLLCALVDPIPRRKAMSGSDTIMMCFRKIRAGGRVCLFAEGDACWDGVSAPVFSATGKMVRSSGASLVTYRLEGGYFSLPRWGKKLRRGKMRGHVVGIYSPEQLKAMTPAETLDVINRDIYEDAWQRQREEQVTYKAAKPAEHIEQGLFICPKCGSTGTLQSQNDRVFCSCGFETRYTDTGFFDPPAPFETFLDWDKWQFEEIAKGKFDNMDELFCDDDITLKELQANHSQSFRCRSSLRMFSDRLAIEDRVFPLKDIHSLSIIKANVLLFSIGDAYYELKANHHCCMRKYLMLWQHFHAAASTDGT